MIDYTIPKNHVAHSFEKEWGGSRKMSFYAKSDGISSDKAMRDRILGNLGEVAAYGALTSYGIKCKFPNLDTVNNPDKKIWPDDLIFDDEYSYKGKPVLGHHSVKGQYFSVGKKWGISWLWQMKTFDRHRDPMLVDPNLNCFFIGVQIDDSDLNENSVIPSKVSVFYWPEIYKHIAEPGAKSNIGKKKAIYLKDVEHLEVDLSDVVALCKTGA